MSWEVNMVSEQELREIENFLYLEARLCDESRYLAWEELLEDDMFYWVPRGEGDFDPNKDVSLLCDNRTRLTTRIRQLATGMRYSQVPPSPMRRVISNIEVTDKKGDEYTVFANFVLLELQIQSTHAMHIWGGRTEYRLRRKDVRLKMFYKKVMLVNGNEAVPSISFLL